MALGKIISRCKQFKMADWIEISVSERTLALTINEDVAIATAKLDGCSILKTDRPAIKASPETVHNRYKDLALVEWAFRICKTSELELRLIHVRLATRTRGHVFVVMLAYRIVQEPSKRWRHLDVTVQEGLDELATLCTVEVETNDGGDVQPDTKTTAFHQDPAGRSQSAFADHYSSLRGKSDH